MRPFESFFWVVLNWDSRGYILEWPSLDFRTSQRLRILSFMLSYKPLKIILLYIGIIYVYIYKCTYIRIQTHTDTHTHTHTHTHTGGVFFFRNSHVLFLLAQLAYTLLDVSCMYDVWYDDILIEINKRSH